MRSPKKIAVGLLVLGGYATTSGQLALGGDHLIRPKTTPAQPHTERLAGYPHTVSAISMVSYNEHYSGGYVGGGRAHGGSGPCIHQGTWGWDYTPFRSMFEGWSNGRRAQGGIGSYATDGPKPIEHLREAVQGRHGEK